MLERHVINLHAQKSKASTGYYNASSAGRRWRRSRSAESGWRACWNGWTRRRTPKGHSSWGGRRVAPQHVLQHAQLLAGSACAINSLHSHRCAGSVAAKMQCTLPRRWAGALRDDLLTSRYMSTRADTCVKLLPLPSPRKKPLLFLSVPHPVYSVRQVRLQSARSSRPRLKPWWRRRFPQTSMKQTATVPQ